MYIGGDFDCMIDYVNAGYPLEGFVRFCLGYSGWDVGQLDDELKNNVWAVTSMKDADTILQGSGGTDTGTARCAQWVRNTADGFITHNIRRSTDRAPQQRHIITYIAPLHGQSIQGHNVLYLT